MPEPAAQAANPTPAAVSSSSIGHPNPQNQQQLLKNLQQIENLVEKIAGELALCEPGSDQGMVPLYSLFSELLELLADEPGAVSLCEVPFGQLSALLDEAGTMPESLISGFGRCVQGLQTALRYAAMELDVPWEEIHTLVSTNDQERTTGGGAEPASSASGQAMAEELLVLGLDDNREILEEFYQEASEHLESIEAALLDIEEDPSNVEAISSIFRSFHTIKGVAGFLDLRPMQRLAHEVETLLDFVRSGKVAFHKDLVSLVLESRDRLQLHLLQIQEGLAGGGQPSTVVPVGDLIEQTLRFHPQAAAAATPARGGKAAGAPLAAEDLSSAEKDDDEEEPAAAAAQPTNPATDLTAVTEAIRGGRAKVGTTRASIRMDLEKLDSIIDAVGELVIVESQLRDSLEALGKDLDARIERNLAQLGRITGELQRSGLSLRMVSLKSTFQKMQRLARDLAAKCGKQVNFVVEGEDTEMDRSVVEEISDPLVHMIRNALDHGLEPPEERERVGKNPVGTVLLRAYYSGDNIVLELKDDGRGVDTERVLAKAIQRGLAQEGQKYSKDEIIAFLFMPGFSTAEKISDVSGRGVGMDVVKTNVKKLRGRIDMRSEWGRGSLVRISLPLTMAIIDGLLVRVGSERFILPVSGVNMALNADPAQIFTMQGRGKVIRHRDEIFRLLFLADFYNLGRCAAAEGKEIIVMVESDDCEYGLVVDEVLGKQEVVVKHLGGFIQNPDGVSGGAILGDGTIALILDPAALARASD